MTNERLIIDGDGDGDGDGAGENHKIMTMESFLSMFLVVDEASRFAT